MATDYPRDMVGYGATPPDPKWPGGARLALQIVLNYEEGAESCVLHGDAASETFLSEIIGAEAFAGVRHKSMESLYEYGSRAGVWRLLRLFEARKLPVTVFGVGMALARNPEAVAAMVAGGHEIASHGWRWISYQFVDEARSASTSRWPCAPSSSSPARGRSAGTRDATARTRGASSSSTAASSTTRIPMPTTFHTGRSRRQGASRRPLHARLQRHALRDA